MALKRYKEFLNEADAGLSDVDKAQHELSAIERWLKKSDLDYDDWDWDGDTLTVIVGEENPEKYSRADLKEVGVDLYDIDPLSENVSNDDEENIMQEFDAAFHGSIGALKAGGTPVETINALYDAYNEFSTKFKSILS